MISVIIPAYNAQAYLRECLESVLAQSFSDWEAIVVDDGSTDGTAAIALSCQASDSRIRVITTPNRGVSAARNTAIDIACGEWVTFLDSDDLLPLGALEVYMKSADRGAGIIVGQWARAGSDEPSPREDAAVLQRSAKSVLLEGLYQTGVSTMVGAKMYSRRVIEKVRFQEDIRYEDLVFFCEALTAADNVTEIDAVTYFYRDNPHSFINTFSPARLDVLKATERIEALCASDAELLRAAHDRRLSAAFNMFGLLCARDAEGRYDNEKNYCWRLIREYRDASLHNPCVRIKNKMGGIVSCLGRNALAMLSRIVYR